MTVRSTGCIRTNRHVDPALYAPNPASNPAGPSPLIATLFGAPADAPIETAELREPASATLLYPSEAKQCAGFAPKRVAEFAAGRLCARYALTRLGITAFPIAANADRSPRWPTAVVGSITHTQGFCGVALADGRRYASIGIDAERIGRITSEMETLLFTAAEAHLLSTLHPDARARMATLIFSAKEAYYKYQYPLTHAWRGFHDVTVRIDTPNLHAHERTFAITAADETTITDWGLELPLPGRYAVDGDLVVTGVAVGLP